MKDNHPIVIFWSDADEACIADVPDLRSRSAHGDTLEGALREVLVARRLWLESARAHGEPLPDWRESPYLPEIAKEQLRAEVTT